MQPCLTLVSRRGQVPGYFFVEQVCLNAVTNSHTAVNVPLARREAEEEMGALPAFKVHGEIKTVRGKRGQKHYSVFIAEIDPVLQGSWIPVLNSEHSHFQWCSVEDLNKLPLHPVVSLLVSPDGYQTALLKSLGLESPSIVT